MTPTRTRLLVLVVGAALTAAVAVVVPALGAAPAFATHPCASSSSGTYDPNPSADHDACTGAIRPAEPVGDEVVLTLADSGHTVQLAVGQELRVELQSGSDIWPDVRAGGALHRHHFELRRDRTVARFTALSPTSGQQVSATSDAACLHAQPACASVQRQWQVTVVVGEGAGTAPAPSPTCTARAVPSIGPGLVLLEERSDSSTVTVDLGQRLYVAFGGCGSAAADYGLPIADGPLLLADASADNPGGATSTFRAVAAGTADLTAVRDAPCLHQPSPCAVDPHVWHVTVQVVDPGPCEMTNGVTYGNTTVYAPSVPPGSTVRLHGHVLPNARVRVWFRALGSQEFTVRRELLSDADGAFATTFRPGTDHRWYATSGGCTTTPGLTRVVPDVAGPSTATRGTRVSVTVRGPALQPVQLWMRGPGGSFALRRTGRLDSTGAYRTSYVAATDQRYYAVTGPDRRSSSQRLTQLR